MKLPKPAKPGIEADSATVTRTAAGAMVIRVELAGYITPSLNTTRRQHWGKTGEKKRNLSGRIAIQLVGKRPAQPFARARLTIERHSTGTPDTDNLWGGTKDLVDCLLDPGKPYLSRGKLIVRHPCGLAILSDDSPAALERQLVPVRVKAAGQQKTVLLIEELV